MNQYQIAQKRALEERQKKAFDDLFDKPSRRPKAKGATMVDKLDDLQKQIEELQKEREALLSKERANVIEDINAKIRTFNLKPKDLIFGAPTGAVPSSGRSSKGKTVAPKYQLDSNVWTGRGRKPKWVEEHLEKGGSLDEILIK